MLKRRRRLQTVQSLLGEIGQSVGQCDRMAVQIRIDDSLRGGLITTRDAERLRLMLDGLRANKALSLAG